VTVIVESTIEDGDVNASQEWQVATSLAEAFGGFCYTQQGFRSGPFFVVEPAAAFGTAVLIGIGVLACLYANDGDVEEMIRVSYVGGAMGMMFFSASTNAEAPAAAIPLDGDPKRVTTPTIRFYETKDGWILVGAVSQSLWAKLCLALNMPELLGDPRYQGAPFNIPEASARVEFIERFQSVIRQRTTAEWNAHFRDAGVVVGPLLGPTEAFDDAQVIASGLRVEIEDDEVGNLVVPAYPVMMTDGWLPQLVGAPSLGDHDVDDMVRLETSGRSKISKTVQRKLPPLAGLRVLDFSTMAAGPGVSRIMAGLGADVIKIEPPEGDPFRGLAFSFVSVNRGKQSVATTVSSERRSAELDRLISSADVVVHNFRPSVAKKLGLTSEELTELNAGLVEVLVSGHGSKGPDVELPSIDSIFEARTGGPLLQGGGKEPVGFASGPSDNGTTLLGTFASLAALCQRKFDQFQGRAEVSLLATSMYRHSMIMVRPLSDWSQVSLGPDPVGPISTHRLYEASDGWLMLAITDAEQWSRFHDLDARLPNEFAPTDPAWGTVTSECLGDIIGTSSVESFVKSCQERGIPAVRAQHLRDYLINGDDLRPNMIERFTDSKYGEMASLSQLIDFEAPGWRRLGSAPLLGSARIETVAWSESS
jgi:crotonobetainyl-CoA:carnitine CoA-transferase CaiB-like acyl-CoA transferase